MAGCDTSPSHALCCAGQVQVHAQNVTEAIPVSRLKDAKICTLAIPSLTAIQEMRQNKGAVRSHLVSNTQLCIAPHLVKKE